MLVVLFWALWLLSAQHVFMVCPFCGLIVVVVITSYETKELIALRFVDL